MLLRSGAKKNQKSKSGQTALQMASSRGSFHCTNALLEAHADTEAKNEYGNTALILAASCDHEAALRRLLEAGADTEAVNDDGATALLMTARLQRGLGMRALLQYHAYIDAQDEEGDTSLNTVVGSEKREVFTQLLCDAGASTEVSNYSLGLENLFLSTTLTLTLTLTLILGFQLLRGDSSVPCRKGCLPCMHPDTPNGRR